MRKLTIEEIRPQFEKRGWKLLSEKYVNSRSYLDVICQEGHKTTISWNNFQRNQGCQFCAGNQKFDFHEVKKYFHENGCTLLSEEYVSNQSKLEYICNCGNKASTDFITFRKGGRCLECKKKKLSIASTKELPIEKMKSLCEKSNAKFVQAYRKNGRIRLNFICKCGKPHSASWRNFQKTQNCKKCGNLKVSGENSYMWNSNRELIETNKLMQKRCYSLVRRSLKKLGKTKESCKSEILGYDVKDLKNSITNHKLYNANIDYHIDHIFPVSLFIKNKIEDMKLINHINNLRPLHSSLNLSKADKAINEAFQIWINNSFVPAEEIINQYITSDFQSGCPDGVILNLNPRGFHKSLYFKNINNNLKTIYVLPYEWVERKQQIIQRYNTLKGINFKKIGARECKLKLVERPYWRNFCNEFHVQGANSLSKVIFGLYKDDVLVAGLSLGRHHRGGEGLILDRLCFRNELHVVGGTEKLMKAAISWAKSNNYNKITSFSNNRYTNGDVYQRNGFYKEAELVPDYSYMLKTDFSVGFSKQSQKKNLVECPPELTEGEWAKERGLEQIWDCGKVRWAIDIV